MWAGVRTAVTEIGRSFLPEFIQSQTPAKELPLRLFVAGFGRSGTTSLAHALEQLGYTPCYGPPCLRKIADRLKQYHTGELEGGWQTLFQSFDVAGLDALGYQRQWYRDAAKMGLPVILTVRDSAEAWADSWAETIGTHFFYMGQRPFTFMPVHERLGPYLEEYFQRFAPGYAFPPSNFDFLERRGLAEAYEALVADVKTSIPPQQLLVFNSKDGWAPLCAFLHQHGQLVQCPRTPYPRSGDRATMVAVGYVMGLLTWTWLAIPLLPIILVWLCYRRCSRSNREKAKRS
jgi:hypothetical protein